MLEQNWLCPCTVYGVIAASANSIAWLGLHCCCNLVNVSVTVIAICRLLLMQPIKATTICYSSWMGQLFEQLKDKSLNQIAIPGSHNAGTYALSSRYSTDTSGSKYSKIDKLGVLRKFIKGWSVCQNSSIADQLNLGIRYFDIRLCVPRSGPVCVCHCLEGPPLREILDQVERFLMKNPLELVILEFKHFDKFSLATHEEVLQ